MPPGFHRLIAAQFASALADNAVLIVTIALLQQQGSAPWLAPLLKFGFTLSYVLLAPVVGPLADAFPKARLMAVMNGVKVLGVLALLCGLDPLLAFTVIGFGAAAYAPAKYGLITELVPGEQLVRANGWIEVSVVCAALLGTVLGGALVSPWLLAGLTQAATAGDGHAAAGLGQWPAGALSGSLLLLLAVYAAAALLNAGLPDSGARYPASAVHPLRLTREFLGANRTLWRDPGGGLSLAVTTIFWGVGATLQFAVLGWAAQVLLLPLEQAAYLQGAVALGVIAGAAAAARWVTLSGAGRMLPLGVLLGAMIAAAAFTPSLAWALPLLAGLGAVGGLLVVPLNALLQHRGHQLLSAGRSIAVQGFNENASVLGMLAVYAGLLAAEVPIVALMCGFGLCIALAMALLCWRQRRPSQGCEGKAAARG
jgi:MFS family permease